MAPGLQFLGREARRAQDGSHLVRAATGRDGAHESTGFVAVGRVQPEGNRDCFARRQCAEPIRQKRSAFAQPAVLECPLLRDVSIQRNRLTHGVHRAPLHQARRGHTPQIQVLAVRQGAPRHYAPLGAQVVPQTTGPSRFLGMHPTTAGQGQKNEGGGDRRALGGIAHGPRGSVRGKVLGDLMDGAT